MTITSTLVNGGLTAARLPLTVAELALQRGDHTDEWSPALAFDALSATVKQVVGALTRDQNLADDGRLIQARVGQLRRGEELETLAETLEAEADAELTARREIDEQRRRGVKARTADRKRDAKEAAEQEAANAAKGLADRAAKAAEADAEAEAAANRRERMARSERLKAERIAIAREKRALSAKSQVEKVDAQLEEAKGARRNSR